MNTFRVEIKKDGEWVKLDATPVFPLRWGVMLDERLDEAYLNTINDSTPEYEPTTEMRIIVSDGAEDQTQYYIVANDKGERFPTWSDKYRHEIQLIERTKLLEGVYCSALTFTNHLNDTTVYNAVAASLKWGSSNLYKSTWLKNYTTHWYYSPVQRCNQIPMPPADEWARDLNHYLLDRVSKHEFLEWIDDKLNLQYVLIRGIKIKNANKATIATYYKDFPLFLDIPDDTSKIYIEYTFEWMGLEGVTNEDACSTATYEIEIIDELVYKKKNTVTDIINRTLECAEYRESGFPPKYKLNGVVYQLGQIAQYDTVNGLKYAPGSEADMYDKIIAPEFSLPEGTLREQLGIIASFIHGEIWLDDENILHFVDYNKRIAVSKDDCFIYDSSLYDINSYCTDVVSNVENLVSSDYNEGSVTDPSSLFYSSLRSKTEYTRVDEKNGVAKVSYGIYGICKVLCGVVGENREEYFIRPYDITDYVYEKAAYNSVLSDYGGGPGLSKSWAIYYEKGSKIIDGLFFRKPHASSSAVYEKFSISNILSACSGKKAEAIDEYLTTHIENVVLQVEYQPITQSLLVHSKQKYIPKKMKYMRLYNQGESLVESSWFGEKIKGVAARVGNAERTRVYILNKFCDIPIAGAFLESHSVSEISIELYPFYIKCALELTKDFNKISEYVGISSEKRLYEIPKNNVVVRNILIHETLVVGRSPINRSTFFKTILPFKNMFMSSREETNHKLSFVRWDTYDGSDRKIAQLILPLIVRPLGNVISISFAPKDNYSAGDSSKYISGSDGITGQWNMDARYTDRFGHVFRSKIRLYCEPLAFNPTYFLADETGKTVQINQAYDHPLIELPADTGLGVPLFSNVSGLHVLDKDAKEIPKYNIELEIKTNVQNLYIGSGLSKQCGFVQDLSNSSRANLYIIKQPCYVGKFTNFIDTTDDEMFENAGVLDIDDNESWTKEYPDKIFCLAPKVAGKEGEPYYGWVVAMPTIQGERIVVDQYGVESTETVKSGGDVLLFKDEQWTGRKELIKENELYFYYIHE